MNAFERDQWIHSDEFVRTRLGLIEDEPVLAASRTTRRQLTELDQLAECMIGRHDTNQTSLKAAIQREIRRWGPDRTIGDRATTESGAIDGSGKE